MCIIFLWRRESNVVIPGPFKLILAANRDEVFKRPAKHAEFWEGHSHILAGKDLTEGAQGGTWLGMTKTGRISALTNIWSFDPQKDAKKGRGFLITNYLNNVIDGKSYLANLRQEKYLYRPFNIIAGNVLGDVFYTNNKDEAEERKLQDGFTCLTNGTLNNNWLKSTNSLKRFENILHKSSVDKEKLLQDLTDLLRDKATNYPDDALLEGYPQHRTSIFVPILLPESDYGTRTHTIILVDNENKVTFLERTKTHHEQSPEDWLENKYEFVLE